MFPSLDTFLINRATGLMRWLNESMELTAPKILRESLMAFLACYFAFAMVVLATGQAIAQVAVVICGIGLFRQLTGVLKRYAADADKDWTSNLAMKYMAQAVGKQESMRFGRLLGWISLAIYPALDLMVGVSQPFSFVFVYYAAMGSGLVHEYLAAAEPTAPGQRRRSSEMQLAFAAGQDR